MFSWVHSPSAMPFSKFLPRVRDISSVLTGFQEEDRAGVSVLYISPHSNSTAGPALMGSFAALPLSGWLAFLDFVAFYVFFKVYLYLYIYIHLH